MARTALRRTTHTYNRADVAAAVQQEADRRGCSAQDVVNDILARVLIDGVIGRMERELNMLYAALGGAQTGGALPAVGRAAVPSYVPAGGPRVTVTDDAGGGPTLPPRRGGGNQWD